MTVDVNAGEGIRGARRFAPAAGNVGLFLFLLSGLYLFLVLVSPVVTSFFHPDELHGFTTFQAQGWFGGIYTYWLTAIGRYAAIAWFGIPFTLSEFFGIWPWYTVVAARLFGFLFSLVCVYLLIRELFPGTRAGVTLAAAALFSAIPLSQTRILNSHWLLDQAIYLISFSFFCLTLVLFWRLAKRRDVGSIGWFAFVFFAFLGTHEVNLVLGGAMLGLFAVALFLHQSQPASEGTIGIARTALDTVRWPIPKLVLERVDGPWRVGIEAAPRADASRFTVQLGRHCLKTKARRPHKGQRLHALFVWLSIAYVSSALIQLMSPSLVNRNAGWPAVKTWPEAIEIGFTTGLVPLYDLTRGFGGGYLPLFAGGLIWGLWWYRSRRIERQTSLLLLLPLALALLNSVLTATLAGRTGVLENAFSTTQFSLLETFDTSIQFMPIRQSLFAHQLFDIGALCLGLFTSQYFALDRLARTPFAMRVAFTVIVALWIVHSIITSPVYAQAKSYGWQSRLSEMSKHYATLRRDPGFDGKVHMEWPFRPSGPYQMEVPLAVLFKTSGPVQFVPCGIASLESECGGTLNETLLDARTRAIGDIWTHGFNGARQAADGRVRFTEDESEAEHFLQSRSLAKAEASIIDVSVDVDIANYGNGRNILLYLISPDGTAFIQYDLETPDVVLHTNFGARPLNGKILTTGAGTVRLWGYFFVEGSAGSFNLRVQGVDRTSTIYPGNSSLDFEVTDTRIRVVSGN